MPIPLILNTAKAWAADLTRPKRSWNSSGRPSRKTVGGLPPTGRMIDLLKKSDSSFRRVGRQPFRAVNRDEYMVDLFKPRPMSVLATEPTRLGDVSDLEAAEIGNLEWLVSSPKFSQVVIGNNGYPAAMVCPDPRAFAVHKIWMSRRTDRDPLKKQRDRDQALTVAWIVNRHLPQYEFSSSELKMFPKAIVDNARRDIDALTIPDDFA